MPLVVPDSQPIPLSDLKDRLQIREDDTAHDETLAEFLAGALAEYESTVGPAQAQAFTRTVRNGIFPHYPVASVASAVYVGGDAVDLTDLDSEALAIGVLKDIYGRGYGAVTVTYTAGGMPANHREAVLLDVEGLWRSSQRGGGSGGARSELLGGDDIYERATYASPLTLYPRIRALAGPTVA